MAAEFAVRLRSEDIPADVIDLAKKSILDALGLALAAAVDDAGKIVQAYLEEMKFGNRESTVIGTQLRVPAEFAAFANGVSIHAQDEAENGADDEDDAQLAVAPDRVYGLPAQLTACFAAAFAVAESKGVAGSELLLAYRVGVEVEAKMAEAIFPRRCEEGFRPTGVGQASRCVRPFRTACVGLQPDSALGTFGAAAAAMKLCNADAPAMARALDLAASQAAGLRENFGTMTKPFHAGRAAQAGIVAADMAAVGRIASDMVAADMLQRGGRTVSERVREAPRGFFRAAHADLGQGSPIDRMSFEDVAEKFEDCAIVAQWPREKIKATVATVRKFEEIRDVRTLAALVRAY